MKRLSVYLAGPITGLDHEEATSWRDELKKSYGERFELKSPLDRDAEYVDMVGEERNKAIAYGERLDILNSDATIAFVDRQSMGTAMGILYAFLSGRTVVVVLGNKDIALSPMVSHHQHFICESFQDAFSYIEQRHSRATIESIHKRKGGTQPWDQKRIEYAIQKAIKAVLKDCPECSEIDQLRADKLTEVVVMKLEDDLLSGKVKLTDISVESVQDVVEHVLMINSHLDEVVSLAKAYVVYRSKRNEDRNRRQAEISSQIAEENTKEFITTILHDIKGPAGNIRTSCELARKNIQANNVEKALKNLDTLEKNQKSLLDSMDNFKLENELMFTSEIINLGNFFDEITKSYYFEDEEKKVEFITDIPADIYIETRLYKLKSIFKVLFDNAIKHGFGNKGGKVFIKVESIDGNDDVAIFYWNNGKSISKVNADFILSNDKSYVPEKGSWKYGLFGAKSFVSDLGGLIECYPVEVSAPEDPFAIQKTREGLICFQITLRQVKLNAKGRSKILIADNTELFRNSMADFLDDEFDVLTASNTAEALEIIKSGAVHGLVTDVDFGEAHDGIWLLEQATRVAPHVRVVVMSGIGSDDTRRGDWKYQAKRLGARPYEKHAYKIDEIIEFLKG